MLEVALLAEQLLVITIVPRACNTADQDNNTGRVVLEPREGPRAVVLVERRGYSKCVRPSREEAGVAGEGAWG